MARYLLLALNGPTDGPDDEAEFNRWYNEVHLPDLRKITGNVSTRRFKVVRQNRIDKPYIAATEFETDNPDALMGELAAKAADFTHAIDRETSIFLLAVELDTSVEGPSDAS